MWPWILGHFWLLTKFLLCFFFWVCLFLVWGRHRKFYRDPLHRERRSQSPFGIKTSFHLGFPAIISFRSLFQEFGNWCWSCSKMLSEFHSAVPLMKNVTESSVLPLISIANSLETSKLWSDRKHWHQCEQMLTSGGNLVPLNLPEPPTLSFYFIFQLNCAF